eukprot:TRINITY_DN21867_c0_g3_i1.p1 TRINITY_DN21867_c0_g3~~TRINITY_DN21867_c0_g3_i1.p1  ORF type:complete len:320 (+),score=26.45 TRINITY_DN21867_c0_g3_i1:112-1071(+)
MSLANDPLQALNDEVRVQVAETSASQWLPLESNPEIFSNFCHKIGLARAWEFVDVLSLDQSSGLLGRDFLPRPCAGLIFLFPCTRNIYAARQEERDQLMQKLSGKDMSGAAARIKRDAFHITQVASFGNACGTVAAVHLLTNLASGAEEIAPQVLVGASTAVPAAGTGQESSILRFRNANASLSPHARGQALVQASEFKAHSDRAAVHVAAQTSCPSRDGPALDHHYCAFVPFKLEADSENGLAQYHLIELDGTKVAPVDHGPFATSEATEAAALSDAFLAKACDTIRTRFTDVVESGNCEFAAMALCRVHNEPDAKDH